MRRYIFGCALALISCAALLLWFPEASEGVRRGLSVCGDVIIPSLFPFFVLGAAIMELGLPQRLSRRLSPAMSKLFGAPGAGASALVMGLMGGYPLGAATAAGLAERGVISRAECRRLLGFCNNSGPAFLIGAAGVGVFGSVRAGAVLYFCHILAALSSGIVLRDRGEPAASSALAVPDVEPGALARAVT